VTEVPGASAYFDRGFVTYAYDAKRELLGVSRESLDAEGRRERGGRRADGGGCARPRRHDVGCRHDRNRRAGRRHRGEAGRTRVRRGGLRRAVGTEASFVRTERVVLNGDRGAVKRKAVDTALDALVRTIREVDAEE